MIQFDLRFFQFKIGGQKPPTTEAFRVQGITRIPTNQEMIFSMANQPTRPKEPPSEIRGLIRPYIGKPNISRERANHIGVVFQKKISTKLSISTGGTFGGNG